MGWQGRGMRMMLMALALAAGVGQAVAADVLEVVEIARDPSAVWVVAGPWCAPAAWHPAVSACEPLEIGGKAHRRLKLADGTALLERAVDRDEAGLSYRYALERGPLPVRRLRAQLRVEPAGAGARVTWRADVEAEPQVRDEVLGQLAAFYRQGLDGLRAALTP